MSFSQNWEKGCTRCTIAIYYGLVYHGLIARMLAKDMPRFVLILSRYDRLGKYHIIPPKWRKISVSKTGSVISRFRRFEMPPVKAKIKHIKIKIRESVLDSLFGVTKMGGVSITISKGSI